MPGWYASANSPRGLVPLVNRKNGVPTAPPWHAAPSPLNGVAMHDEEIGSRTSAWAVGVSGTSLSSSTNVGLAALTKWPTNAFVPVLVCSRHVTYGVLPENVMSGRVESMPGVEIGWPPLTIWKCGVGVATNRETNTWWTPPTVSSQVTHGTVGLAGFIVPAATCGSSASAVGLLFSEHACSALRRRGAARGRR